MEELEKGTGSVYNSKYQSSRANTMSARFKDPYYNKLNTPGPGAYQTFSEFGIYKSKYADSMEKRELKRSQSSLQLKRNSKTPNPTQRKKLSS